MVYTSDNYTLYLMFLVLNIYFTGQFIYLSITVISIDWFTTEDKICWDTQNKPCCISAKTTKVCSFLINVKRVLMNRQKEKLTDKRHKTHFKKI